MYCALADIEKVIKEQEIIELTDDEETGSINSERVDAAITRADS
ncbi:protein of unknown function DUF1320 [Candidatus Magnetoovum chiemensis]|nr:protein of unknown function DUF1320 [Candidatus Magnetoovum chiemensis]